MWIKTIGGGIVNLNTSNSVYMAKGTEHFTVRSNASLDDFDTVFKGTKEECQLFMDDLLQKLSGVPTETATSPAIDRHELFSDLFQFTLCCVNEGMDGAVIHNGLAKILNDHKV